MEDKIICLNRAASHEYFILERIECGIVLDGGEVKSLRMGNCNLKDSFCTVYNGELFIKNMHVSVYDKATAFNEKNARRDRKLLLHKQEIIATYFKYFVTYIVTIEGTTIIDVKK